jgi:hypothetical protein
VALGAAGTALDDNAYFARISSMRVQIALQARGVRESNLHPDEALAGQRYHSASAYRSDLY